MLKYWQMKKQIAKIHFNFHQLICCYRYVFGSSSPGKYVRFIDIYNLHMEGDISRQKRYRAIRTMQANRINNYSKTKRKSKIEKKKKTNFRPMSTTRMSKATLRPLVALPTWRTWSLRHPFIMLRTQCVIKA